MAIIDTDPQGSLSHWWNSRGVRSPQFAKVSVFDLQEALAHLRATGIKLVVIDTLELKDAKTKALAGKLGKLELGNRALFIDGDAVHEPTE